MRQFPFTIVKWLRGQVKLWLEMKHVNTMNWRCDTSQNQIIVSDIILLHIWLQLMEDGSAHQYTYDTEEKTKAAPALIYLFRCTLPDPIKTNELAHQYI